MPVKARLTRKEKSKLNLSEKFVEYCRKNPVYAAKVLFNVELTWYQRIILKTIWSKMFVLILMGRGIGKTWLGALAVCLYAILYPRTKIGIITPVFRQVGYFFDYINEFYETSDYFKACCSKKILRNMNREYIQFLNGSYIEGLPLGDGNKIRGRRYNFIFIDEYAQVPEDIIKLVIRPMLSVRKKSVANKLVISSTAFWPWNHFYKQYLYYNVMITLRPELYGLCEYTYLDLISLDNPPYRADEEMMRMAKADSTEEQFAMEYLCKFPVDSTGFFTARLIEECTPKKHEGSPIEFKGRDDREYVMGVDAARVEGGDNFVIQILRLDGDVKRLVYSVAMNGQPYHVMAAEIRRLVKKFNIVRIFMDAQGGGMAIYDIISQPVVGDKDEAMMPIIDMENKDDTREGLRYLKLINPTRPVNNDIFHSLKAEMQHQRMLFPITTRRHNDSEVEEVNDNINQTKQELMMLIAEGQGQWFAFSAPSGKKKDRAVSLALANAAAKDYLTVDKPKPRALATGVWI